MKRFNKRLASYMNVYVQCPTTGKTIEAMAHDDKVICNCPAAIERGGTHVVALCQPSTVDKYMKEHGLEDTGV